MLVHGELDSFEYVPSRLNPSDGMTKPDPNLRIPVLRLMEGRSVIWIHDPLITGDWRPKPTF